MDLTRPVGYRGFSLNTVQHVVGTGDMVGCEIGSVEYGQVLGHGYDEKKALSEGYEASDVFLGKRLISMAGTIYGRDRAEAFDLYREFAERMTPSDAYAADPSNRGYLPFDFYQPTRDTGVGRFPSGLIHQMLLARPMATPSARFDSDRLGGPDSGPLAIPWSAQLEARDPRILNYDLAELDVSGASGSGVLVNRGNRPAVLDITLVVPPDAGSGEFRFRYGGNRIIITLPNRHRRMTYRYDTHHRVLAVNGDLRMDLLSFTDGSPHTHLRAGSSDYSFTRTVSSLNAGSYVTYRDTWA